MSIITDRQLQAQAVMETAKVVETTHEIHASGERPGSTSQGTSAADQVVQPLAEGCVEAFDEGGVDHAYALLRGFDQPFYHFLAALYDAPINRQYTFYTLFDDLHDGNVGPGDHFASADLASPMWEFAAKGKPKSGDITGKIVYRQQQRTTKCNGTHLICQRLDQIQASLPADHAAQPRRVRIAIANAIQWVPFCIFFSWGL